MRASISGRRLAIAVALVGLAMVQGCAVMTGVYVPDRSAFAARVTCTVETADSGYTFHGRRDRMIKKRGYRIELGEIESALSRHDDVERAANPLERVRRGKANERLVLPCVARRDRRRLPPACRSECSRECWR